MRVFSALLTTVCTCVELGCDTVTMAGGEGQARLEQASTARAEDVEMVHVDVEEEVTVSEVSTMSCDTASCSSSSTTCTPVKKGGQYIHIHNNIWLERND